MMNNITIGSEFNRLVIGERKYKEGWFILAADYEDRAVMVLSRAKMVELRDVLTDLLEE